MPTLMFIAAGAALGAGIASAVSLHGDVQAEMAAICFIGSAVLFGLRSVLDQQRRIIEKLASKTGG